MQYLCYHCEVTGHTWPNCYKWLSTQQSNCMISSGNQNQFSSSFVPFGDLLKTLIFLSNWTVSILPLHRRIKGLPNGKVFPRYGRKKALSDLVTLSLSLSLVFELHYLCVFAVLFWVSLVLCFTLFNMFLFVYFQFCFILFFIKIKK